MDTYKEKIMDVITQEVVADLLLALSHFVNDTEIPPERIGRVLDSLNLTHNCLRDTQNGRAKEQV